MKIEFQNSRAGRLEKLVGKELPFLRRAFIQKLFRCKEIKVGGSARQASAQIKVGERVAIFLPDPRRNFAALTGCAILFEDADVIVFDKRSGLPTHAGMGTGGESLSEAAAKLLQQKLTIVHRLDRDTSGVIVFAKNKKSAGALAAAFRERTAQKIYHAVVVGVPPKSAGTIRLPLKKVSERIVVAKTDGQTAETSWKISKKWADAALLEVAPKTGRTHQIRVHLAAIGYPILGDKLYNPQSATERMKLHASRLQILDYDFQAKIPPSFDAN